MNYIRYHEVEKLFAIWPVLEEIIKGLSHDMNIARSKTDEEDEYIYNMCIGNKALDDMPPAGKITDITGSIAVNYAIAMRHDKQGVKREIKGELLELSLVIDKLGIAFRRLSPLQRYILILHYWDGLTWGEIVAQLKTMNRSLNKQYVQKLKRSGIEKMARISRITIQEYERIMRHCENEIQKRGDKIGQLK